ncbi:protein GrpE [Sesamum alatum]|uniref:GrpE protein homolog n=1 Tax=Sesamum alatum TaxID=300844 RepID=A0AAE2CT99_9LAMI|nr:protein GrpE [Sesamum alatum]
MAASASASASLSPYTPHGFSLTSSRPANHLCLQRPTIHQFNVFGKSISRTVFSTYPVLNSYRKNGNPRIISDGFRNQRRSFFEPSVSAQEENQPDPTNNLDEFQAPEGAADRRLPFRLKSIMQAYKEAILDGDRKAVYELEDMIFMMEKEKNELAQKVAAMSAEISSGKEKLIRLQADFDNYRKRSEKERLTVRSDAQGEVIESLLPMVDSFERAKQQIKLETEMEKKIDTSYQGIYKQFVEIMRSLRVAAVPTVGKPFDPKMHEAIAREESYEFKEGIVIQEFRRGFYLGDRLLRPAMVKVSSGPGKKKPASAPDQSSEEPASVAGVDNR